MIRPLLLGALLATTPALAQPALAQSALAQSALAQPATPLAEAPDKACVSDRPAQPTCPVLAPTDEVSLAAEAFGATRLREWRPGLGPDRTLRVFLGRADAAGTIHFAPRPVPVLRACLDRLATPGTEVRYVRAVTRPRRGGTEDVGMGEGAEDGPAASWLVALTIPAPDGGQAVIAITMAQLRMYLWPEAGAEVGKGKIRSRRERMHAGVN